MNNKLKTQNGEFDKLLTETGKLCDALLPTAGLGDALNGLITAREYNDKALVESSLTTALTAFATIAEFFTEQAVEAPRAARQTLERAMKEIEGKPSESFDELGNRIRARFDNDITSMMRLREKLVGMLLQEGYEVRNAQKLDPAIEEMRRLRDEFLKDWPWATRARPAVNRKMISESLDAIRRGEGESVDEIIRQLEREAGK